MSYTNNETHDFKGKRGIECGEMYAYRECTKCHCIEDTLHAWYKCPEENMWPKQRYLDAIKRLNSLRSERETLNERIMETIYEIQQHKKEAGIE